MGNVVIYIASEADVSVIREMAEVVFRQTYKEILSPGQMEYMMEMMYSSSSLRKQLEDGHVFHIITMDGSPCGYMSVGYEGNEDGISVYHLHKLYVLPSCQGRGYGRTLLDAAISHVRENKDTPAARLELNVNRFNPAVGFYARYGMKVLRQGDFHIGKGYYMNDYIMGMDL